MIYNTLSVRKHCFLLFQFLLLLREYILGIEREKLEKEVVFLLRGAGLWFLYQVTD